MAGPQWNCLPIHFEHATLAYGTVSASKSASKATTPQYPFTGVTPTTIQTGKQHPPANTPLPALGNYWGPIAHLVESGPKCGLELMSRQSRS